VLAAVRLTRAYLPGMTDRGWGRIQYIASDSAVVIPAEMIHYGMTKTALLAVSRGFAKQAAGTGVTVNSRHRRPDPHRRRRGLRLPARRP
jgi:NAD(P)-dependent dehydrogenase (short-subunit alcohol dehydrogenase family)